MPFCGKCGAPLTETAKFCPSCGTPVVTENKQTSQQTYSKNFTDTLKELNNTEDTTNEFDPQDIEKNRIMALFAYLGPLVLVPLFGAKDSNFARFHANQGLVLLIAYALFSVLKLGLGVILATILPGFAAKFIMGVIKLLTVLFYALIIVGIVNAANGKAKELPVIGGIKILK